MSIFSAIFGSENDRSIKKLKVIADAVEALNESYSKLSDLELQNKTKEFKSRLAGGETLEDILPEAFATVREASSRVLNLKHYYVQILGGIALHQGRISEMKTGEGKTLVETLPAYLNALTGNGVHIVTVNEYLAKRDSEWMGKVFTFLGLTVGITLSATTMDTEKKRNAYLADITYGTNSEMGFDYLRDNMCKRTQDKVQRGLNFAIVDEVDSVLIDEARTPLIISGGKGFKNTEEYVKANNFAKGLSKTEDLDIDEEKKQIRLTDSGVLKAERYYGIENLSDIDNMVFNHFINNAIRANYMLKLDSDYIVQNGEVLIVDEFTGRVMAGRRFSDGLHEALEAKEGVSIHDENVTVATITYQNYFRLYKKLSGMTGTAKTEEIEFNKIYNLDVVCIPTNKPINRKDNVDIIFANHRGKIAGVVQDIKTRHSKGQPILVGTLTVEKSEELSNILKHENVKHVVLNAKNHEKESEIVAQAGQVGAVTIATNMAGRGTDILLGGNAEFMAKTKMKQEAFEDYLINQATSYSVETDEKMIEAKKRYNELYAEFKKETDKEKTKVIELGGLYILGTERHESRRIDNQLRGRAGRQGDIGESTFYVSLDDDLARIFGGDRLKNAVAFFNMPENEPLFQMKIISKQIENAQKRVEGANFAQRRTLLQFDDVLNTQREIIYKERDKVLSGADVHDEIMDMVKEFVAESVNKAISDEKMYYEWDLTDLNKSLEDFIFHRGTNFVTEKNVEGKDVAEVIEFVTDEVMASIEQKKKQINEVLQNGFENLERWILLKSVDNSWVEHIDSMTIIKREILTRTNPVDTYKEVGFDMFSSMIAKIRENSAKMIINANLEKIAKPANRVAEQKQDIIANATPTDSKASKTIKKTERQVGRNEPCPCGSGKKYKNCCGKNLWYLCLFSYFKLLTNLLIYKNFPIHIMLHLLNNKTHTVVLLNFNKF